MQENADALLSFAATVSYNGSPFHGFARQEGLLTVQGELERALELLYKRAVPTVCAGRTDTGVHALGQVVSFTLFPDEARMCSLESLARSLNAITDPAIAIRSVVKAPEGFSARFDAVWREYRYFMCPDPTPPLVMRDFCWHIPCEMDIDAMHAAAQILVGEHDFKSFCLAASAEGKSTIRKILSISVEKCEIAGQTLVCMDIIGTAFLHSMVRTIAGTLVPVGQGRFGVQWVSSVLQERDRKAAGQTAPAQGLVFWKVEYPEFTE